MIDPIKQIKVIPGYFTDHNGYESVAKQLIDLTPRRRVSEGATQAEDQDGNLWSYKFVSETRYNYLIQLTKNNQRMADVHLISTENGPIYQLVSYCFYSDRNDSDQRWSKDELINRYIKLHTGLYASSKDKKEFVHCTESQLRTFINNLYDEFDEFKKTQNGLQHLKNRGIIELIYIKGEGSSYQTKIHQF